MQFQRPHGLWRFAITLAGVAGLTTCLLLIRHVLGPADLALCFVPLVLVVAIRFGRSAAVLASFASFLAYNFFFVPPFYTLTVAQPRDLLELCVLLGVSLVAGALAAREHALSQAATHRAEQMTALYNLSQEVSAAVDSKVILPTIATTAIAVLGAKGIEITLAAHGGEPEATIVAGERREASAHTVPIVAGTQTLGTLRVWGLPTPLVPGDETLTLVTTIANQVALTVERAHAAAAIHQSRAFREADRLKSALLSSVSHDLRTPLAVIKTAASSLRDTDITWDAATQQDFADTIVMEADRLNRFVRNLLEMSRLEAGTVRREPVLVEIGEVINAALDRLRPLLAPDRIEVDIAPDLPPAPMDAVQIELVLSNLLENAAKFAPSGTAITLSARQAESELIIAVADRGPGIPLDAIDHIFEKFYRVAAPEHEPGGSGLGLAICQAIVQAHGGRIWAVNRPGGGAIFHFTLPCSTTLVLPAAEQLAVKSI